MTLTSTSSLYSSIFFSYDCICNILHDEILSDLLFVKNIFLPLLIYLFVNIAVLLCNLCVCLLFLLLLLFLMMMMILLVIQLLIRAVTAYQCEICIYMFDSNCFIINIYIVVYSLLLFTSLFTRYYYCC